MEINMTAMLSVFLALLLVLPALAIPLDMERSQEEQGEHIDDKRPKYMDTRDLEDMMEDLIFDALKDLASKGKVNPNIIAVSEEGSETNVQKRRRHLSFCLRRSGRTFRPYPCYKSA